MIIAGIPAFNEEKSIARVIILVRKHVDKVIVLDDGSTDMTGEIARSLGAQVITHDVNKGKGEALRKMFLEAERQDPDVFVTIDADGQHDANQIPSLVSAVRDGADVVIGSRYRGEIPRTRRVGNEVLNRAAGTGVLDAQSGFRAYNGHKIGQLIPTEMGMGADAEILRRAMEQGMKIVEVPISVSYEDNTPTQNPMFHGLDVLLTTVKQLSIRHPLVFYGVPGTLSLVTAVVFWWWTLTNFAEHHSILTNVALIAVAATIVGLILMAIALLLWVLISVVRERSG